MNIEIELICQLEILKTALDEECAFCNECQFCNPKYVAEDGCRTMLQGIKPESFIFVIDETIKYIRGN